MTSIVSSLLRGSVHDDEHGATITIRPAGGCATVKHFAIHADDEYIGTVSRYEDGSGWRASMSSKGFFPSIAFGNTMDESICNAIAEAKAKSLAHKRAVDRLESLLFRLDHTGQTSSRQPSAKTVVTRQRQMRIVPAVAP